MPVSRRAFFGLIAALPAALRWRPAAIIPPRTMSAHVFLPSARQTQYLKPLLKEPYLGEPGRVVVPEDSFLAYYRLRQGISSRPAMNASFVVVEHVK